MPRALMNFDHYKALWWIHFIEADCKTLIGAQTGSYHFATVDGLRSFVIRCNVWDVAKFEHSVRAWGRGSEQVNLTDEQYAKLK
jgi:hypothetical protein